MVLQPRNRCKTEKLKCFFGVSLVAIPTHPHQQPNRFKNMFSTSGLLYSTPTTSELTCRGGSAYAARSYPVRVIEEFGQTGKDSEALLAKRGGVTDLTLVRIRDQEGGTFTEMRAYIDAHADRSKTRVAMPWQCVEVCVGNEWVPGYKFYSLTQPSTEDPNPPPGMDLEQAPAATSGSGFDRSLYKKLRYDVRISPKSADRSWYAAASKDGVMSVSPHDELYRSQVKSGGKYYSTLWAWLKNDPLLPVHEGILCAQSEFGAGDPWEHIDVLVGDGWVDGSIFSAFRQQICSQDLKFN